MQKKEINSLQFILKRVYDGCSASELSLICEEEGIDNYKRLISLVENIDKYIVKQKVKNQTEKRYILTDNGEEFYERGGYKSLTKEQKIELFAQIGYIIGNFMKGYA